MTSPLSPRLRYSVVQTRRERHLRGSRELLPVLVVALASAAPCGKLAAQEANADKPLARYTPTVKLIERCMPAVASVQTLRESPTPGVFNVGVGSASLIHEAGYLLTNDHVVSGIADGQVLLPNMPPVPFRTIAGSSTEDLALIKIDVGAPLSFLPLGRSHDLMLGEPVLVIGNPGGLAHSVSTGIISGLNRSAATGGAFLPWMVQTSAAVSGGNSGGPLINALGEQIGVITSKKLDSENINFAIAVDRVREVLPNMLAAELRFGFALGATVDMYHPEAVVKSVAEGSPALAAGVAPGDIINRVGKTRVRDGLGWQLALVDRKPGEVLRVGLRRGAEDITVDVELGELGLAEPVPEEGMTQGLRFEAFTGEWDKLPDFDTLTPVETGSADTPSEAAFATDDGENYGLRFTGFVKVPRDGLYTFHTASDDGSRLYVGGQLLVDNDGLHSVWRRAGMARLKAGLHPITITFFERGGEEKLEVSFEGPEVGLQTIPKEAYFMRAPNPEGDDSDG